MSEYFQGEVENKYCIYNNGNAVKERLSKHQGSCFYVSMLCDHLKSHPLCH